MLLFLDTTIKIYFTHYILSNLTIYSLLHGSSYSISSFLFQDRDNDKSFLSPVGSASARLLTRPRKAKLIILKGQCVLKMILFCFAVTIKI